MGNLQDELEIQNGSYGNSSYGWAKVITTLKPNEFAMRMDATGIGSTYYERSGYAGAQAQAEWQLDFSLEQTGSFLFQGYIEQSQSTRFAGDTSAAAKLTLRDDKGTVLLMILGSQDVNAYLDTVSLQPGVYHLTASAFGSATDLSQSNGDFSGSSGTAFVDLHAWMASPPVPEPGSAWLMGLGLAGVGCIRRGSRPVI